MSNLNLSGTSDPIGGNQYYRVIRAHGTRSAFEPGSIDCCKIESSSSSDCEDCLCVNLDLSCHTNVASKKREPGAGPVGHLIPLASSPHLDPHCLVTGLTFDGNNSISSTGFQLGLGVIYGDIVSATGATGTGEFVDLSSTFMNDPTTNMNAKQVPGEPVVAANINVGQVILEPDGEEVIPTAYTGGEPGTLALFVKQAQETPNFDGKLKVCVKYVCP